MFSISISVGDPFPYERKPLVAIDQFWSRYDSIYNNILSILQNARSRIIDQG